MADSMECHCIPTGQLPHTTKLFADFLENFPGVKSFYAHPPTLEGMLAAARQAKLPESMRRAVVEVLREQNDRFGADGATRKNLDRLASGAVAVVTGQQVGLFSGPAFSFYKALAAIALARQLTEHGADAVPVFWLATEDHDLAEINHSDWLDNTGELIRIELPPANGAGHRVGEIPLGPSVVPAVERAAGLLKGPASDEVAAALRASYQPEESYGSGFAKLMARFLAGRGIILLDALDPRLHRLAAPVYRRALDEHLELSKELVARGKALDRARYHVQVKVTEPSTLLFFSVDGQRLPLRPRNHGFAAGKATFSAQEVQHALEATPEVFSANVLLRPVVQDTLLPTAVYVGGPAEVAYFAQAEVVYRRLLGRMPAIVTRSGFTLVEPHVAAFLKKYSLDVPAVWRGKQYVRAQMERQTLPRELARQFAAGEKSLRGILAKLRKPVGKLDRTLAGALDTAERKMLHQFLKLRSKAGRAESLRTGVLDRHERILLNALYPHHGLQERTLGLLQFLSGHGRGLLDSLEARAHENRQHHILFL